MYSTARWPSRLLLVAAVLAAWIVAPRRGQAAPRPAGPAPFVVVIDPGHGGANPGCRAAGGHTVEKEVTLALAKDLRAALEEQLPGVKVVLTREEDVTMTLAERAALANRAGADLFISLHANASPGRDQTGFETYVLDARAATLEAARTARRENDGALAAPGSDPAAVVAVRQLTQSAHLRNAARLARLVQRAQAALFPTRPDRGVRQAPFDVLMGVRAPAILFEAAFLDHPQESAVLVEPARRRKVAEALAAAVAEYDRSVHQRMAPPVSAP